MTTRKNDPKELEKLGIEKGYPAMFLAQPILVVLVRHCQRDGDAGYSPERESRHLHRHVQRHLQRGHAHCDGQPDR
jgi:hypothetical protein